MTTTAPASPRPVAPGHTPLPGDASHRRNLAILADHLDRLTPGNQAIEFSYLTYARGRALADGRTARWPSEVRAGNVTACCAAGHGPLAGIPGLPDEGWVEYIDRAFLPGFRGTLTPAWSWLFSSNWFFADNTPRGAAARIGYALDHGVPEDAVVQSMGRGRLGYAVPDGPAPSALSLV